MTSASGLVWEETDALRAGRERFESRQRGLGRSLARVGEPINDEERSEPCAACCS